MDLSLVALLLGIGMLAALATGIWVAVALFAVALAVSLFASIATGGTAWQKLASSPFHLFLGGVFVASYVLAITFLAPRMGVATAVLYVLLGQMCSAALIDQFGLLGAARYSMTPARSLGLILMAAGVFLARRPA